MMIVKCVTWIFNCSNKFSFRCNLNKNEILHILSSKQMCLFRVSKDNTNCFELIMNSSTTYVSPEITMCVSDLGSDVKIEIIISENIYYRKLFFWISMFIIVILVAVFYALLFEHEGVNKANLLDFIITLISMLIFSVVFPKTLYLYERNKSLKKIKKFLRLF